MRLTRICITSSKTTSSVGQRSFSIGTTKKIVTKIRGGETCRSIVGYDANALYLWALMQDMPCGWYTRPREGQRFRPQRAQPYGQMPAQWLTWVSIKTGRDIPHQTIGREKRIDKLLVDGWCAETRTAYQFHGCYFHGCRDCFGPQETNTLNGKRWHNCWMTQRKIQPILDVTLR